MAERPDRTGVGGQRRGRHGPPFRPPWWPENEPFPPSNGGSRGAGPAGAGWHRRRRFVRRVGFVLAGFFVLTFVASALAVALLSGALGLASHRGLAVAAGLLGLLVLLGGAVAFGRAVRRSAAPLADLMEAADRVAAGDYDAHVEERGGGDMRRLARSFNEMTDRLRESERTRRDLLSDVAHELRTPLAVIQGSTEAMLDGLHARDHAHLEPILEETNVMARLLDDLQTLSTADAGALRLHREPIEPTQMIDDVATAFASRAEAARVRLETRVQPGLPSTIDVDPVRIGEVLSNLVSNAIRHTPPDGVVTVSVGPTATGEARAVAFSVADTGPGIASDALPHVFDRFVKSVDSGGAGLGLAIARGLVEAHGGSIAAEGPGAGGTTMRFVLPVAGG